MAWQDLPIVLVTWHDAHGDARGWSQYDDLDSEPCIVHTAGFHLVEAKKGHISVAQSITGDDLDSVIHIPTAMVVNVRNLELDNDSLRKPKKDDRRLSKASKSARLRGAGRARKNHPSSRKRKELTEG